MKKECLFVCYANYCRSPVAEKIFNSYKLANLQAESGGITQFYANQMDPRSKKYLEGAGIQDYSHIPKMIQQKSIDQADYIFALDLKVFQKIFSKFNIPENKLKLINYYDNTLQTNDPLKYKSYEDYKICMSNISNCVNKIIKNISDDQYKL